MRANADADASYQVFYDASGNLLNGQDSPSDRLPVWPGSMIEGVAMVMCGREDYLTGVIADPVKMSREYFASGK